jgi:hypothetical protein
MEKMVTLFFLSHRMTFLATLMGWNQQILHKVELDRLPPISLVPLVNLMVLYATSG